MTTFERHMDERDKGRQAKGIDGEVREQGGFPVHEGHQQRQAADDRKRRAGVDRDHEEPVEARQAGNYLGYYAALGLYPCGRHQGLIFHNILGGSMTGGTTLRRFFALEGEVVHLTFPPTTNRQGIRASTYVNLRRLSDVDAMLGR